MNTKTIKIISAILIALVLTFSFTTMVSAADKATTGTFQGPDAYKGTPPSNTTDIDSLGNKVIGILRVLGSIVAVIILMVLGFKYMMGSAEDKADYKKSMIPYIVGAVCIFLAPFIAGAIYSFVQG